MKLTTLLTAFFSLSIGMTAAEKKPNIVFIFADDLSYEAMGHVGKTEVKTPYWTN